MMWSWDIRLIDSTLLFVMQSLQYGEEMECIDLDPEQQNNVVIFQNDTCAELVSRLQSLGVAIPCVFLRRLSEFTKDIAKTMPLVSRPNDVSAFRCAAPWYRRKTGDGLMALLDGLQGPDLVLIDARGNQVVLQLRDLGPYVVDFQTSAESLFLNLGAQVVEYSLKNLPELRLQRVVVLPGLFDSMELRHDTLYLCSTMSNTLVFVDLQTFQTFGEQPLVPAAILDAYDFCKHGYKTCHSCRRIRFYTNGQLNILRCGSRLLTSDGIILQDSDLVRGLLLQDTYMVTWTENSVQIIELANMCTRAVWKQLHGQGPILQCFLSDEQTLWCLTPTSIELVDVNA